MTQQNMPVQAETSESESRFGKSLRQSESFLQLLKDMLESDVSPDDLDKLCNKTILVGLDIGGGNCSGAWASVKGMWDEPANQSVAPRLLFADALENRFVHSVVGYKKSEDGSCETLIGRKAANSADAVFQNFKKCPSPANLMETIEDNGVKRTRRQLMVDHLRVFFDSLCNANPDKLGNRDNIVIVIGRPSGLDWTEACEDYCDIAREATGVDTVFSVKESRAAMFYARYKLNKKLSGGVLIIDCGAYTIDATYARSGEHRDGWDESIHVGGHDVDRNLLRYAKEKLKLAQGDLKQSLQTQMFAARLAKEDFYDPDGMRSSILTLIKSDGTAVMLNIDQTTMDEALEETTFPSAPADAGIDINRSWMAHLDAFLSYIADRLSPDASAQTLTSVIITGGASNMIEIERRIRTFAHKRWGKDIDVTSCNSESMCNESVACGGVLYIHKALSIVMRVPSLFKDTIAVLLAEVDSMAEPISTAITDFLFDNIILPAAKYWAEDSVNRSNDYLRELIEATSNCGNIPELKRQAIQNALNAQLRLKMPALIKPIAAFLTDLYKGAVSTEIALKDEELNNLASQLVGGSALNGILDHMSRSIPVSVESILENVFEVMGNVIFFPITVMVKLSDWIEDATLSPEERKNKKLMETVTRDIRIREQRETPRTSQERVRAYNRIQTDKSRRKFREKLTLELRKALKTSAAKDGLGIPSALLTVMSERIRETVYCD